MKLTFIWHKRPEFCDGKWTKKTNNRQFGRTIGVIECSIVRVSWCREDFQRIIFFFSFLHFIGHAVIDEGLYWVPLLPLIVYNFSGQKGDETNLNWFSYAVFHASSSKQSFSPVVMCGVKIFETFLWCDQWTVKWTTNNGTFLMHKLANRVETKTIVSSFNQRLQMQELQWNIHTIKYAMTFISSFNFASCKNYMHFAIKVRT